VVAIQWQLVADRLRWILWAEYLRWILWADLLLWILWADLLLWILWADLLLLHLLKMMWADLLHLLKMMSEALFRKSLLMLVSAGVEQMRLDRQDRQAQRPRSLIPLSWIPSYIIWRS
jgi:hypothetical protein